MKKSKKSKSEPMAVDGRAVARQVLPEILRELNADFINDDGLLSKDDKREIFTTGHDVELKNVSVRAHLRITVEGPGK